MFLGPRGSSWTRFLGYFEPKGEFPFNGSRGTCFALDMLGRGGGGGGGLLGSIELATSNPTTNPRTHHSYLLLDVPERCSCLQELRTQLETILTTVVMITLLPLLLHECTSGTTLLALSSPVTIFQHGHLFVGRLVTS